MAIAPDKVAMKYYLKFDNCIKYGSPEHYFHFIWGYLLPALNEIIKLGAGAHTNKIRRTFLFRSCGPIMDGLIYEIISLYGCSFEIIGKEALDNEGSFTTIIVPRWDVWLLDFINIKELQSMLKYLGINWTDISLRNILLLLKNNIFKSHFLADINNVKTSMIHKIDKLSPASNTNYGTDSYLILKRSPQPAYYKTNGGAEIPTYGTARRALLGIEAVAEELGNKNITVQIYEPGRHTLAEQIKIFQNCKGIVGIKGAEFANLIWMKPNSKVIVVRPSNMDTPQVQKSLAKLLGLNYIEITTEEGSYPTLTAELVLKYLIS